LAYLLSLSLTPATGLTRKELLVVEEDFRDLAKAALPCTVSLLPGNSQIRSGMGSGIIVSPEGLILTAAHVALEMNEAVMVLFPDGKRLSGRVLGMDYARDSAMVQIEEQGPFPHVELGQSDDLEVNDWCIAMGHAGGYQPDRTPPVRLGRILNHRGNRFLTSDCALIGGDSGGPLFDRQGRLIGIHSNIGVSLSQNNHVPISAFLEKWNRLLAGERFGGNEPGSLLKDPDRPMIGAILGDLSNGSGSIIKRVIPDSPAEKAGLQKGDIIQRVQNQVVANTEELLQEIRKRKPGAKLSLRVRTGQITEEREITLAAAHRLQTWPQMGPNFNPTPSEPAPEPRKFSRKERAQLQEEFNQKMRDSIESGFLQFQPGELDRFGGREYLMDFLRAFERVASPKEREALMRMGQGEAPITPKTFDPSLPNPVKAGFFREVLDAFRPAVSEASQSTHLVFLGQEWKSLCTIVHEDGYALTKASEVNQRTNKGLNVLVEKGHLLPATIVKTLPRYDLALLKIEGSFPFVPVEWNSDRAPLPLGSLLAAAGPGPDARALGVVSVQPRALSGRNRGFEIAVMADVFADETWENVR
ncbi:MAG: trypsin-like peptidase domain-containing protein, partial [Verrucomicrobiota bacterium]